jgi:hypothetical protein
MTKRNAAGFLRVRPSETGRSGSAVLRAYTDD